MSFMQRPISTLASSSQNSAVVNAVIALAQINPVVGDIDGNTQSIIDTALKAKSEYGAQLVLFPELAVIGYPPEDLLLRPSLAARVERALSKLKSAFDDLTLVVGYPRWSNNTLYNAAGVFINGELIAEYFKQYLPNYQVFDEKRYFSSGKNNCVIPWQGIHLGINICEDIWSDKPIVEAKNAGAELILNLNASPFHKNKQCERESLLMAKAKSNQVAIAYANLVGGQDDLVFDGGSCVFGADGKLKARAKSFKECLLPLRLEKNSSGLDITSIEKAPIKPLHESIYEALVLGVKDYINKNRFKGIVLGLSGGIDSALTLAIAVDALGPDRVEAVMMPYKYTSQLSRDDAADQARHLGVKYHSIEINSIVSACTTVLDPIFHGLDNDTTEENIQARSRALLLMAISNKKGYLVLTTGNKSELAVGYATLYGDMVGGFNALKDVSKTLVYELANHLNQKGDVIPKTVITRPPSAELAPDQVDQDSLPDYEVLDQILEHYIEKDLSAQAIIEKGFDKHTVYRVLSMVDRNEYKRRQAVIGVRITERGFGRDRRYPITNAWPMGD